MTPQKRRRLGWVFGGLTVVAGLLLLLNIGWLMQARGWLEAAKQKQRAGRPGMSGRTSTGTSGGISMPPSFGARSDRR